MADELADLMEPEHSPKGASSAERWMNCPGSGVLLDKVKLPQTDEPEYRAAGIAAHEAAAHCLKTPCDTWEIIGMKFHDVVVDKEMADAIQMYLDFVRPLADTAVTVMVEQRIGGDPATRPHKDFYGTVDFAAYATDILDVVDYKHGEGIVVEPDENPQLKYYAYGILHNRIARGSNVRSDRIVRLSIVQPRAFHYDGPIRTWETTAGEIIYWAENELIPAMERAELDTTLEPGKWCRFCPAKLFCPAMDVIYRGLAEMTADEAMVQNFGQNRLGGLYCLLEANSFMVKAIKDEVYRRNMLGNTVPGTKLVMKKANRIFKEGAEAELKEALGEAIYSKPELKSPAEVEKIGPAAKKLVQELAYMPQTGLTVAPESDTKPAVKVEKAQDVFAHLIEQADNSATSTNGELS